MKSHELTIRVQVRLLLGELTNPQSNKTAICSLSDACRQTVRLVRLHNPQAGIPARVHWANPRNNPWSVVAHMKTRIALDPVRTLNALEAMSAERIAQMPQSAEREALLGLNNAFAGNGLEGTISLGGASAVLSNMDEAYPIQRGTPWKGFAIATPTRTDWRAKTMHLDREGPHQPYRTLEVLLAHLPAFLVDAAGSSLICVQGSGTINGSTLSIARVKSIRVATQEDLAAANMDGPLF